MSGGLIKSLKLSGTNISMIWYQIGKISCTLLVPLLKFWLKVCSKTKIDKNDISKFK